MLVGEAKWAHEVDGPRLRRRLQIAAAALPVVADDVRLAVAARERVRDAGDLLTVTAGDVFGP